MEGKMTEDLIARLRHYREHGVYSPMTFGKAADALEAKDKRIAELELAAKWEGDLAQQALEDLKQRDARIAVLEAALKPFADAADDLSPYGVPLNDYDSVHGIYFSAGKIRAARALLEGK